MASRNLRFNTFTPRSPIGEGVRDFMTAMFAGQGGGASGGSNRSVAQDEADLAQALLYRNQANLYQQTHDARANLKDSWLGSFKKLQDSRTRPMNLDYAPGDDGLGFDLDTSALARMIRQPSDEPEVYALGERPAPDLNFGGMDGALPPPAMPQRGLDPTLASTGLQFDVPEFQFAPEVRQSYGEPSIVSREAQRIYELEQAAAASLAALTSNPDQIAGAVGEFQKQGFNDGLLDGLYSPEQYAVLHGRPLQAVQGGHQVSLTNMDQPVPLGLEVARAATEGSKGAELESRIPLNQARAKTEGARQNLYGEQAETQGSVRERNLAAAEKSRQPSAAAGGKPTAPKKFDVQTIEGEIASLLQAETGETNIDAALLNRIKARAMELFEESHDHFDAAATAVEEVKNEIEVEGAQWWNPKTNKIVPKAGLGPRKPTGGLPQPKSKQEYDALPDGTRYIGTDGQQRTKGGA